MTLPVLAACAVYAVVVAPRGPSLADRIDKLVTATPAAPTATDAEFLRRVTLDLTGTIPTATEARTFLTDADPAKRTKLIDRLLASPGYARRLAHHFDVTFLERRKDVRVPRSEWERYLREAFAANKPYDQLAREILANDGTDPKNRAPAKFVLDRDLDPNVVTRDIGRVFLGRNLQCAQCHDHPLVEDYKQDQYYGLLAFLNRTYLFPKADAADAVVAEKPDGEVSFVSVFDAKKAQKGTPPRVPGLEAIPDPPAVKGKEYAVAPAKDVRPVPAYSRRAKLAAAVTDPQNKAFARTAVNRVWAMMLGRGLVHPLDMDHPDNPPSHPELLDLLTAEFAAHKYDVKWLVREIAKSKTYQRSGELPDGQPTPPAESYRVALLKPLSPEQLAYATFQATGFADAEYVALGKSATAAALDAKLAAQMQPFRGKFGASAGEPEDGFVATLDQALFMKHGGPVRGLTVVRPGNTADRMTKAADPTTAADELFLSVLTRFPTADERAVVAAMLSGQSRGPAASEAVWALVASAEFRFNH